MDRRLFLQRTAAGLVAAGLSAGCTDSDEDSAELAHPGLIEMLGAERVREIGRRYRAGAPKENTVPALRDAISSSRHHAFPWLRSKSIGDQVRDDFAAGRVVVVGGWVLSETEARQAALYSLST